MKIIFLLESISQPRCIKRINSFRDQGFEVSVYGIDRNKYNINTNSYDLDINIIGNYKDNEGYIYKLLNNFFKIRKIVKNNKDNKVLYYSFGYMLTFILLLNKVNIYVYEMSDIIYGRKRIKWVRWFFKFIDKRMINNSVLTVMTSEGFYNYFFNDIEANNIIIQKNKLDISFSEIDRDDINTTIHAENLIFSYVGAFRYPNTIFRFARIIGEKYPHHSFHFYGESHLRNEVEILEKRYNNIKYFGPFKNPDDLSGIYDNIDIVVACYDTSGLNERIAEPNKLYESIFFKKPIIVSKNTYLEKKVKELKCGMSIDATNDQNIINFINNLNQDKLDSVIKNIDSIKGNYTIDDNSKKIMNYINEYIH